jgi:hypothetical protein
LNEIHRRTALSALGLTAVAAAAKAGPLNPPAGAVAPTGRTNDEIYNKIPAPGASDGRIPIAGGTLIAPINITQPGNYVLLGNITLSGVISILNINSSGVTLDLNGFRITQSQSGGGSPISISGGITAVTVRNGSVFGGTPAIAVGGSTAAVTLEDVNVFSAKQIGIALAPACRGTVIRRCAIHDTGATTTPVDASLSIIGFNNNGAFGTRVEDCIVSRLLFNGTGTPQYRGISMTGAGNAVIGCQVFHDAAITGTGITVTGTAYRANSVANFSLPYAGAGADGGGNV